MNFTYLSPKFHYADFRDFAAYCNSRNYNRDDFARTCNIVSRLHNAGLSDADLSTLSCETLCSLIRGRPYDSQQDRKIASGLRRYLDYLIGHCRYSVREPVDISRVSVSPLLPRTTKTTTKDRIIAYMEDHGGDWISAAELSIRFNVYTQTLRYLLASCTYIEISRPSDYRDTVRYRYVSPEGT